jgi:hypothetical protein
MVMRDYVLSSAAGKRIRLRKGDWLVTGGTVVGRFDKDQQLDWLPLEWVRGTPVLMEEVGEDLTNLVTRAPIPRLQNEFQKLMFIEPGEPTPDMPMPSLAQLSSYLKARRTLVAYTYDRRI